MGTPPKDTRERLREARAAALGGREEMAAAATQARSEGIPVGEIAQLLGFKTRRSVYQLIERGH
jgi:hypothetical protein